MFVLESRYSGTKLTKPDWMMKMKAKLKEMKARFKQLNIPNIPHYTITFAVAIILYVITDARPAHPLDSPHLYGQIGFIVLLGLTFAVAVHLGLTNARRKWLYPIISAFVIFIVLPLVSIIYIRDYRVLMYFLSYHLFFGFFHAFLPLLITPLLGVGLGRLIRKI